jgi:hypothetical protein
MNHLVLCCGENPHSEFDFCYEVKSRSELRGILTGEINIKNDVEMKQIYEFLFVHNYRILNGRNYFPISLSCTDFLNLTSNDEYQEQSLRVLQSEMENAGSI